MTEDDLIANLLAALAGPPGHGLKDDCAHITADMLKNGAVMTTDTLVAGVHFFPADPPDLIARKALRVTLSDLAAKASKPTGYLMSLALPDNLGDAWLNTFIAGLAADQADFSVELWGGDTVSTPGPLTITITALGQPNAAGTPLRTGAAVGDVVMVTGTIGDAALGLKALKAADFGNGLAKDDRAALIAAYHLPEPRIGFLDPIAGQVSAAMDVSDGLALDLSRLARASGGKAVLYAETMPLSEPAQRAVEHDRKHLKTALTGGDDYEILFTVPQADALEVLAHGARSGCPVTQIGVMMEGHGLVVLDADGQELGLGQLGFQHM